MTTSQANQTNKILSLEQLGVELDKQYRGKQIVLCHGVFDVFHIGHLKHLKSAKALGEILIISLTSDKYVNKGPNRPVFNQSLRAELLSELSFVDFVTISDSDSAANTIKITKPNIYVKGSEYKESKNDFNQMLEIELKALESVGGKVRFTEGITFSSSNLANQLFHNFSPEFLAWRENFLKKFTIDQTINWIYEIEKVKILVVGEVILDEYIFGETLGKTGKEPTLAMKKLKTKIYSGGVHAIAKNCVDLGANTTLLSRINFDDDFDYSYKSLRLEFQKQSTPTIKKTRYIDEATKTKLLEIYTMGENDYSADDSKFIKTLVDASSVVDGIILSDYGHNLFTKNIIESLESLKCFIALNCQTNAGNYGSNSVYKYGKANLITMNSKELNLEILRRHISKQDFFKDLTEHLDLQTFLITKGGEGIEMIESSSDSCSCPGLSSSVVDRVGAGDVVLAVSTLLKLVKAPNEVVSLVSNVAGALSISFLGNEKTIDQKTLVKSIVSLLK